MIQELESGKEMRKGFQLSRSFRELYNEAVNFHLMPHTDQEINVFRDRFAGALFAARALSSLPLVDFPGSTVITGTNLLDFYQKLFPYAEPIEHPLGQSSLNGVSVSDALLTSDNRVVAVCEVTVSNDPSYFLRKYAGFGATKEQFPGYFGDAKLIFITTKDPTLPDRVRGDESMRLVELPFTGIEFGDYINRIYYGYRPSRNTATLNEIQKRVRYQLKRSQS